ncbi:hypothetical protein ONZ45_g19039 [Pleurotus djamor]|nr:hypothetical protein ONZ45_g19039 [Pleurotus djamor]
MTPPLSPASESSECGSDSFPDKPPNADVIRPFCVDSDDDDCTLDGALDEKQPLLSSYEDDRDPYYSDPRAIQPLPEGLLIPSVLPQYTEVVAVPEDRLSRIELLLSAFTMYSELKEARLDSHFEKVFGRLQTEWTYIGGLLVALAAVDTAVFAISDDSIFDVDPYARNAIAASSIASGLGISCDAWFLLRYNWADLHTFIHRAKDIFDSYFFFAISARVPCFCMLISAISLLGFLGRVAYNVWPEGVIIACFVVGMLMTLQFLAKGAVVCVNAVRGVNRHVVRGVGWVARRGSTGTVSDEPAIRK